MSISNNFRAPAAANYLRISTSTLAKRRVSGTGPRYSKLGRIVIYQGADLDEWLNNNAKCSTSETNGTSETKR